MSAAPKTTLEIAGDILAAAISVKMITLTADPRTRQSTAESDAGQIARAFTVIHDAVYNEQRRIASTKA